MVETIGVPGLILSLLFILIYVLIRFILKKKAVPRDIILLFLIGFIVAGLIVFLRQQSKNQVSDNLKSLENTDLIKEIKIDVK